jgi:hypothetical protein
MFEETPELVEAEYVCVSRIRVFAMSTLGVGFLFLIALLSLQSFSTGRIVKGVSVSHVELSNLTLSQARTRLNAAEAKKNLSFVVAGKRYQPSLDQLGAHYDTEAVLAKAYRVGRGTIAPHPQKVDLALSPVIDSQKFASFLAPITQMGTQPVDARLEIRKGTISLIPDVSGWTVNKTFLEKALLQGLSNFGVIETVVAPQTQVATVRAPDLAAAQTQAQGLMSTPISLVDGATALSISPADISSFISFAPDATSGQIVATIAPDKVTVFVATLAKKLDHPATDRKVTIADGVTTIQNEGNDGDAIDREPILSAVEKLSAGVPVNIVITRHPVAFQTITTNLIGIGSGHYIEINLNKQHLWAWDNHAVIYDSPITSGATAAGLGTVTGMFQIYLKKTNTHLVGRDYSVPVKFWMPFYLGYGLHDAVWRNGNFGGQDYIRGGSHGCVNLPDATAEWLYNWADIGTTVYIHK